MLGMAVEASQTERLAQIAQPHMDHLRDTIGESVCLEVLTSGHVDKVAEAVGPPPLSVTFPESLPAHVAAGAKVILAFSDPELTTGIFNHELEKITENTITDLNMFKDQLKEIKQQGIAFDHGEANMDVSGVSAAIFNHLKKPIAAISICVPTYRVNKIINNKSINLLKKTATLISEHMF
jgi:DNA-binding IclR family transcriptional regulator